VYEHTLSDADFDNIGVLYFFGASDAAGNVASSTPFPATISSGFGSLTVTSVSPVSNANDPQPTDYRIFSVPVRNATIGSVFDVTSMDDEKFRVWQYNGSNSELTSTGSSLNPGSGYWLIYLNGEVDLNFGGAAVSASNSNLFTISLRSGLNLVGNPYNFTISWAEVLNHNIATGTISDGDISGLTFYEGSFADRGNTNLGVTQGAFVQSKEPFTIEIPFSAGTARVAGTDRRSTQPLDADTWEVPIDLEIEQTAYRVASVGMHPEAKEGRDKYDLLTMPYLMKYLEFNSLNPGFRERISQDIVPTRDGYIWEFEARSSYDPGMATLSWDNENFGDNGIELMLYDVGKDRVVSMREMTSYSFHLGEGEEESKKFRIYYGDEVFIREELKPAGITLGNAYPNPFNQSTVMPFTLPKGNGIYTVKVEIYNTMGQRVKVLMDNQLDNGYHSISWDGTNEAGQVVSEGIFIYKLGVSHAEGRKDLTGKMIFRR